MGLGSLSNLAIRLANAVLACWMGIPGFFTPKEDDILGILSLILATAPACSGMVVVAVNGCLPGSEAVPGVGGVAAGMVSCQAGAHGNFPALAD